MLLRPASRASEGPAKGGPKALCMAGRKAGIQPCRTCPSPSTGGPPRTPGPRDLILVVLPEHRVHRLAPFALVPLQHALRQRDPGVGDALDGCQVLLLLAAPRRQPPPRDVQHLRSGAVAFQQDTAGPNPQTTDTVSCRGSIGIRAIKACLMPRATQVKHRRSVVLSREKPRGQKACSVHPSQALGLQEKKGKQGDSGGTDGDIDFHPCLLLRS